jgi:hypothetical protein
MTTDRDGGENSPRVINVSRRRKRFNKLSASSAAIEHYV